MLPSLTPAVTRALEAARRFAPAGAAVEPAHLLHGLLEEEDGRAATLAAAVGLDRDRYLAARGEPREAAGASAAVADQTETLLYRARELAVERGGEGEVSSEPVLLALVRHGPGLGDWLAALGLDRERLEALLAPRPPVPLPLEETVHLADLTEQVDIARVLDVGFNRAREALRVVEDYCRFCLDDAFLTRQLKEIRHELTSALDELSPPGLLETRETRRDVGTQISLESERERSSLADMVAANLKRLQEALRSLEEFAKVTRPLLGERLEQLRYRSYTLERAVLLGGRARQLLAGARLYVLLSGSSCVAALDWTIAEAAAGGVRVVQLREKGLADRDLIRRARDVRRWTRDAGVLFLVNDRPDIARLAEADGVHLGQEDLPVKEARRILGPDALIGVSTHTPEQLRQAVLDGADYIGIGPVFPSGTKTFEEFAGLDFVRFAAAETTLPAFAIGGIDSDNIDAVVAAGARRVAVSGAIARADEPRQVAAGLLATLERVRG